MKEFPSNVLGAFVFKKAEEDIKHSRAMTQLLMDKGYIKEPPQQMLQDALSWAIKQVS